MRRKFDTLEALYNARHVASANRFVKLAEQYGFEAKAAKEFIKNKAVHDIKVPKAQFIPIVSKQPGAYQFDTFINDKSAGGINYLMFINVNTRKAYCYPMKGKGSKEVRRALEKFCEEVPDVKFLTSDQDASYLSEEVKDFLLSKNIHWRTTTDNNHNVLGIINRFMRTIRDTVGKNIEVDPSEMAEIIEDYNNLPHRGIDKKAPNEMTPEDEQEYIKKKSELKNPYDFKEGDKVRLVNERSPFGKRRNNVSNEAYIVDGKDGNQFRIRSEDFSVDSVPGYRLIKTKQSNIKIAKTLKDGKRGIINEITGHNGNKYKVKYEGGVKDVIPMKNMREGNPNKLSRMELEYWSKKPKDKIPDSVLKLA